MACLARLRLWVRVFSRRIRPRDAESCGFDDPYLLTVEYSAAGDFQDIKYVDHDDHEFGRYRVSVKHHHPRGDDSAESTPR